MIGHLRALVGKKDPRLCREGSVNLTHQVGTKMETLGFSPLRGEHAHSLLGLGSLLLRCKVKRILYTYNAGATLMN